MATTYYEVYVTTVSEITSRTHTGWDRDKAWRAYCAYAGLCPVTANDTGKRLAGDANVYLLVDGDVVREHNV